MLYRVAPDPAKAQTVQVVHTAWALARAGAAVTLPVAGDGERLLAQLGLERPPGLRLVSLRGGAAGSLRLRAELLRFLAIHGRRGVVSCRHLRYADRALRLSGGRVPLLYEPHEIAAREAATDEGRAVEHAREGRVLAGARWVVANAPGTLALLRAAHGPLASARVCPNGAQPMPRPARPGRGVGVVGSCRPYKDPDAVAEAARRLGGGITWVGASGPGADALAAASGGALVVEPPIPHRDVPARLQSFGTLLLPLSPGDAFGEALTSPLKLWDALQSHVPLVAADTAAVRAAAPDGWVPYAPGDAGSLLAALRRAEDREVRAEVVAAALRRARSWEQRAGELLALVEDG